MNTTLLPRSPEVSVSAPETEKFSAALNAEMSRRMLRVLAAPVLVVGLEWTVSATNKIIGPFVGPFPAYVSALQAQHIFLPGLSFAVRFPVFAAVLAIATETALGITLVLASFFFLRGANRIWEMVAGTALGISAIVAAGLWLLVGRPPFWPDGVGFGSGWPVEFFLVCISVALAVAIAIADPQNTLVMRFIRFLRRSKSNESGHVL